MEASEPLEYQLVAALLADDQEEARRLAHALHARGFDMTTVDEALKLHPELEQPLYAVLQEVIPLSRRAAKRRAIRAAEERDWGDWAEGKKPNQ
jgi:ActR/RegA family two-component response regulator